MRAIILNAHDAGCCLWAASVASASTIMPCSKIIEVELGGIGVKAERLRTLQYGLSETQTQTLIEACRKHVDSLGETRRVCP